jgi:hypothetical protein
MPTRTITPTSAVIATTLPSIITLAEFKGLVDVPGTESTVDDNVMQLALYTATEALSTAYGRSFVRQSGIARIFKARHADYLDVSDLIALHSVEVDENANGTFTRSIPSTAWILEPFNTAPSNRIRLLNQLSYAFWPGYLVRVTGDWGLLAVYPDGTEGPLPSVKMACAILANRLIARRNAPFGVLPGNELQGSIRLAKEDPDVAMLMRPFDTTESTWLIA